MLTKQIRRTLVGIGVLTLAAVAWQFMRPSQPTYDGRTLMHWIAVLGSSDADDEAHAFAAIQTMGTNALPTILRLLEGRDSTWRQKAKLALFLVGEEPQVKSIPALVRLSRAADAGVRLTAVECLSQLMFNQPEVLSALQVAQNDASGVIGSVSRKEVHKNLSNFCTVFPRGNASWQRELKR